MHQLNIDENQWKVIMGSTERIEKITSTKGVFWLKKTTPARGIFRYHALNFFSWLMRLPLLKAVPQPGGNKAIANEVNRIKQLTNAGVSVPELLAFDDSWLLIKDAGQSIIKTMKQSDTTQSTRQKLLQTCLDAMKELHKKNQYLSQGFIRNMLLDEPTQTIIFIDFEDDPLTVMSLSHAQARDVLLLVNSTARFFVEDIEFFNRAIQQFIKGHNPEMVKALKITADRMQWITKVPFQGLLGHDYQKLKVGILALKNI
jgi:tRNA A-37 threonylcarbamoyl transferase component Bud32